MPHSPAAPSKPRRRRWLGRALALRALTVIAPFLLSAALRLLAKTLRIDYVGADELLARLARGDQSIIAFWHNRAVMMPIASPVPKLCIMNSQSRDGEIATRALARWGIRSVRGSATRGGAGGFMQLVNAYRAGYDLAVVPDGPRGPRYVVKPGVIHLARATGAPIYPATCVASRMRRLRNWDRLIIPLPFARLLCMVGEPLQVPRHANDEEIEVLRRSLEDRLNAIGRAAQAQVGGDASRSLPE